MATDRLLLEGLQFFGHHGDVEAERALGGRVDVDVEIRSDLRPAGRSDQLADLSYWRAGAGIKKTEFESSAFAMISIIIWGLRCQFYSRQLALFS